MRRTHAVLAGAVALATVTSTLAAQEHSPVVGAWVVEQVESEGQTMNQPGLIIFTSTHYSIMFATGDGPRALYEGEAMTDAETVAAYGTFVANSGRYEVNGNEITTRAYVAKDPNYMGGWPDNAGTLPFSIDGDTMHLEWLTFRFTLRKVEGQPAPW